mgnify:CR=1 FL=1
MKLLISSVLVLILIAGCTNDTGVSNEVNITNEPSSTTSTNKPKPSPIPTDQASESISPPPSTSTKVEWENVETHVHPFEGTLNSFEIKNDCLISINFSQKVALLVPTDPIDNPDEIAYGDFEHPKTLLVRNDDTESSKLTETQMKLLKENQTYIVLITPWLIHDPESPYNGKNVTGTTLSSIYYEKKGKFYSLKDDSLFDRCGVEGCRRVEK